ncbi:MAG: homoserine O-acetyltransferase, partial [Bacteroidota bacterium]
KAADDSNVIWICHALTANSDAADWWEGLVGTGKLFDPAHHYIVCANMLGSCYGSTQANSINPATGKIYGADFPVISIRDMVNSHDILRKHLGIKKIALILGGSMGGQQTVEWAIMRPSLFERVCILASNAVHSPWGIAFNEAQRMAIRTDPSLYDGTPEAGRTGLEAARALAMISYRNYITFAHTQMDREDKLDDYRASSYQRYQGKKLGLRFQALPYISLSKSMDNHNVGRDRGGIEKALQQITARTLVIGIKTDILFPLSEQRILAHNIPNGRLEVIDSTYGHDGFLIEHVQLTNKLRQFMAEQKSRAQRM